MFKSVVKRSLGMVVLAVLASGASARSLSDLDAVHQAADQRTLVMRVAKAHIQSAIVGDRAEAQRTLFRSIKQYDDNLAALEANSPNSSLNQRLLKLKHEWQAFKTTAQRTPSSATITQLLEGSDDLLFQSDALVRQWRLRLPQERGHFNELALHQSMLSERISLLHSAQRYGIAAPWVKDELNMTIREYEKGMSQLRAAASANGDSLSLDLLQNQWSYARLGLQQSATGNPLPVAIAVAMESLYAQSNLLGEQFRHDDHIAMNQERVSLGLAANVSAD